MFDPSLIFFAVLAAFLCYRLYMVLGTRDGHEPKDNDRIIPLGQKPATEDPAPAPVGTIDPVDEPLWARTVREHFPAFDQSGFIEGAKSAYEMIVSAFTSGDLRDVRPFVEEPVLDAFEQAIETRNDAGQTMEVTFVGIEKAKVLQARADEGQLYVTVAFQADQIRIVRDADGNVIDGDPNRIDLVKDVWTFTRPVRSRDPNWILSATDGAAQITE